MSAVGEAYDVPEGFRTAVRSLTSAVVRPDVWLTRIAAPSGLAPHAVSLAAEVGAFSRVRAKVAARRRQPLLSSTTGRFVLLHDPSAPGPWNGTYRVVTWLRTRMDTAMGSDDLLLDVAWSWLTESLTSFGADYTAEAGTVSRTQDKTFGSLERPADPTVEVEVRASWTPVIPDTDSDWVRAHVQGWADALCTATGLPPHIDGVTYL